MKIDGDLGSNQQPVAIPDDGEIITVHRIPVKRYVRHTFSFSSLPPSLPPQASINASMRWLFIKQNGDKGRNEQRSAVSNYGDVIITITRRGLLKSYFSLFYVPSSISKLSSFLVYHVIDGWIDLYI